jgi:hypothetical protein
MSGIYEIGKAVPLVYTINQAATVVLTVTAPDGTQSTPSLTQTGSPPAVTYTGAVLADQAGLWRFRFVATGAVTDAESGHFHVQPAVGMNVYTTLPELKAALSIPTSDTQDDDDLFDAILVASRSVDGDCQRHFYRVTEPRTLEPGIDLWRLRLGPFNDLVSVTSLKTDASGDGVFETTWTAGEYQLLCADGTPNTNAGPEARPYQRIKAIGGRSFPRPSWAGGARSNLIEITGVWGWPAVPDRIRRAARMMAAEVFKLRDAPFGATSVADLGIIRVRENPKYQALIRDYRLVEAAVPMA